MPVAMLPIPVPLPFSLYLYAGMLVVAGLGTWWLRLSARQAGWRSGGWRAVLQALGWGGLLAAGWLAWLRFLLQTGNTLPVPVTPSALDWALLVLLFPAVEELFFRGVVFANLQRAWSPFWAVFLSALVSMACLSMQRGLAFIFFSSIGYALAFRLSGSLLAPMLAHGLVAALFLFGRMHPGAVAALPPRALPLAAGAAVAVILLGLLPRKAATELPAREGAATRGRR